MTYGFENEVEAEFDFDAREVFKKAVDAVLDEEGCPYEAEVNLLITDPSSMKEINSKQRGIDAETDVLSFPMVDFIAPGDFGPLEDDGDNFNIETGELMLGDIVLSDEKIRLQAREYGHSEKREYAFLIVHSMLHLIGYDHMKEEDALLMEEKQRVIMDILDISR